MFFEKNAQKTLFLARLNTILYKNDLIFFAYYNLLQKNYKKPAQNAQFYIFYL